jgi:hypothetical protein
MKEETIIRLLYFLSKLKEDLPEHMHEELEQIQTELHLESGKGEGAMSDDSSIVKIAKLLRYALPALENRIIDLEKEIEIIKNNLDLTRL